MNSNPVFLGIDLSYHVNKKSYNLLEASDFDAFCTKSLDLKDGVGSVNDVVSFGADRYGLIYKNPNDDESTSNEALTGFIFNKGEFAMINESAQKALNKITNYSSQSNDIILSNTPSGSEIVIFDNTSSAFKTIDLFDKEEKAKIRKDNKYTIQSTEEQPDAEPEEEQKSKAEADKPGDDDEEEHDEKAKDKEEAKEKEADKEEEEEEEEIKKEAVTKVDKENDKESEEDRAKRKEKEKSKKKKKNTKTRGSTSPKFKVKSSIRKVFKHLMLTSGGSLYGLQKSFHKKYVNNQKVIEVKSDGTRCTLCLDENGVLWSFGINLFGKLGLKRNDKKQIYTNPREISIFKAYKVADFGITNRCCIAVCANGSMYGWGSYSKSSLGKNCDIWYTPKLITNNDQDQVQPIDHKSRWRVFAGFRFIMLLNETTNKLYVINTEFGYTLIDKPRNGLRIRTQQVKLPPNLRVSNVIPSNESAIIVAYQESD
eukprot:207437_1